LAFTWSSRGAGARRSRRQPPRRTGVVAIDWIGTHRAHDAQREALTWNCGSSRARRSIAVLVGGKNRASEILSRKRTLTLAMVRALHEKLGIQSELLIREPAADYRVRRRAGKRSR